MPNINALKNPEIVSEFFKSYQKAFAAAEKDAKANRRKLDSSIEFFSPELGENIRVETFDAVNGFAMKASLVSDPSFTLDFAGAGIVPDVGGRFKPAAITASSANTTASFEPSTSGLTISYQEEGQPRVIAFTFNGNDLRFDLQSSTAAPTIGSTSSAPTIGSTSSAPSKAPSKAPSFSLTAVPSRSPSAKPTLSPTLSPIDPITQQPTKGPSFEITPDPTTGAPTLSQAPSKSPTVFVVTNHPVTGQPTLSPVNAMTGEPTGGPTFAATVNPTTGAPTFSPIHPLTGIPTGTPSVELTVNPTTNAPSISQVPSKAPSVVKAPSKAPTVQATEDNTITCVKTPSKIAGQEGFNFTLTPHQGRQGCDLFIPNDVLTWDGKQPLEFQGVQLVRQEDGRTRALIEGCAYLFGQVASTVAGVYNATLSQTSGDSQNALTCNYNVEIPKEKGELTPGEIAGIAIASIVGGFLLYKAAQKAVQKYMGQEAEQTNVAVDHGMGRDAESGQRDGRTGEFIVPNPAFSAIRMDLVGSPRVPTTGTVQQVAAAATLMGQEQREEKQGSRSSE